MTADERPHLPRRELLIGALLVLVTLAVYWPVRHYDYVNYDDPDYVYENSLVLKGISQEGLAWAFGRLVGEHTYWHPVTWVSHMMDCQIFGLNPGAHHLINVLFHAANAILVFVVFKRMTGTRWRSAALAALFAWHPLQVDSVAWIAERKNVLSTFFWLLTLMAYLRYVRSLGVKRYVAVMLLFAVGLMAKPMLVTLPLILLILDFWPLCRVQAGNSCLGLEAPTSGPAISPWRAVVEKLPLLGLSLVSATITILGHHQLGALAGETHLSMEARVTNALVSYVRYIGKTVWPTNLAVFYPHPGAWPAGWVVGASAVLVSMSVWAIADVRRRPYLLAGWLWFLVTLLPTIGIIQASSQGMADRFAYVPVIGVCLMLVWLGADLSAKWRHRTCISVVLVTAILAGCLALTHLQLKFWRDSETLFRHAAGVTTGNYTAEYNLGCTLGNKNKLDEALTHFRAALRIKPDYADAHQSLGVTLHRLAGTPATKDKLEEAVAHFKAALKIRPDYAAAHDGLGAALQAQGKTAEAMAQFNELLRLQPDNAEAHNNRGRILVEQGKLTEAVAEFQQAIKLKPDFASAHNHLGNTFVLQGRLSEAVSAYLAALRAQTDFAGAHRALGVVLSELGRREEAVDHLSKALQLEPGSVEAHLRLGAILMAARNMDEAALHFRTALQLRPDSPEAHYQLGLILADRRQAGDAVAHLREAIRLRPDWVEAVNNLAWMLATQADDKIRNGAEAMRLADRAVELTRTNNAGALDTLAAACAEAGQYAQATRAAQQALALAVSSSETNLARQVQNRLRLYEEGRSFRETNAVSPP